MNTTPEVNLYVQNAGLVLAQGFFPVLFQHLGLINNQQFADEQARLTAVRCLQFVATGLSHTDELLLPLNKVLCGLPLTTPVPKGIPITDKQTTLVETLIKAIIGQWQKIGNCTIEGFRISWLQREGVLVEQEERWELTVEIRAYDLLLQQLPFSFSVIKYPWMDKPLHVTWAY